jgi:hypothetical protein
MNSSSMIAFLKNRTTGQLLTIVSMDEIGYDAHCFRSYTLCAFQLYCEALHSSSSLLNTAPTFYTDTNDASCQQVSYTGENDLHFIYLKRLHMLQNKFDVKNKTRQF